MGDGHDYGEWESSKFASRREAYGEYLKALTDSKPAVDDLLHHFPTYVGHMTLHRALTLYELFKKSQDVAGHIADIGVYKGFSSFLFAKLLQIHEPESLTLVHGFDWFKGNQPSSGDTNLLHKGGYKGSLEQLQELIQLQKLSHILKIHDLDLTKELKNFFKNHPHLMFRLVFFDAGIYEVVKAALPLFYEHTTPGGMIVFDQYSFELAPGETRAVSEILPGVAIRTLPNSWMPNAYLVK